jgi:hypothetical protein
MATWTLPAAWAASSSRAMRARSLPFLVWAALGRVEGLVDDLGAVGGGGGEGGIAGVAAQDLDVVGHRGGAGAVDQPHSLAAAT